MKPGTTKVSAVSLGSLTGLSQAREGFRELRSRQDSERELGLPSDVSADELEARLADLRSQRKVLNPRLMALIGATAGGLGGALGSLPGSRARGALTAGTIGGIGSGLLTFVGDKITDKTLVPFLEKEIKEKRLAEKSASLAEYSVLFDAIDSGAFGSHVKEALIGVCEGMSSSLQSLHAKTASSPVYTEEEARQARLNQLLRKF